MGLTWARMDVGTLRHYKNATLRRSGGWRAIVAGIAGQLHSVEHGTDGFLAHDIISELYARETDASSLAAVGLWVPVAGGYEIHGFADRQSVGNTASKGRSAAAVRWSCAKGHHDKCKLDGCDCTCHNDGSGNASA